MRRPNHASRFEGIAKTNLQASRASDTETLQSQVNKAAKKRLSLSGLEILHGRLPMQYDLIIKQTLREAQGMLRANLPPARNLPDAQAVKSLRALIRTPQVHQALKRGNDTALCFALRAVNRILSDEGQP